jgi:hypothetical protein
MEHRKVESAAVPRNDLRRVALEELEEPTDQRCFAIGGLTERADGNPLSDAQQTGNRDDALQIRLQKVAAARAAALCLRGIDDVAVGKIGRQVVDQTQTRDVGNCLDVLVEAGLHRSTPLRAGAAKLVAEVRGAARVESSNHLSKTPVDR